MYKLCISGVRDKSNYSCYVNEQYLLQHPIWKMVLVSKGEAVFIQLISVVSVCVSFDKRYTYNNNIGYFLWGCIISGYHGNRPQICSNLYNLFL